MQSFCILAQTIQQTENKESVGLDRIENLVMFLNNIV